MFEMDNAENKEIADEFFSQKRTSMRSQHSHPFIRFAARYHYDRFPPGISTPHRTAWFELGMLYRTPTVPDTMLSYDTVHIATVMVQ